MDQDIIIGTHSIIEALKSSQRSNHHLYTTEEGYKDLINKNLVPKEKLNSIKVTKLNLHDFVNQAQKIYQQFDFKFSRIPGNQMLICDSLPENHPGKIWDLIEKKKSVKIICLDQVTDVHNLGAILRTASFFAVDGLVVANKKPLNFSPGFFRVSSGAFEHLPVIRCVSLPKLIGQLQEKGIQCIGLSEHNKTADIPMSSSRCLVLGAEDFGMSYAVQRVLKFNTGLESRGAIQSLNVSIASALAMERFF